MKNEARIIGRLNKGPATVGMLAAELGIHRSSVQIVIDRMRKRKAVHVTAWTEAHHPGALGKFWALGPGEDMPSPRVAKRQAKRPPRPPRVRIDEVPKGPDLVALGEQILRRSTMAGMLGL